MSDPNPLDARLRELGISDDIAAKIKTDLGAESVDDLVNLKETDLTGIGVKPLQARKLLEAVKPAPAAPTTISTVSFDALPAVPDDGSWLEALKVGGVLKVDESTVIAVVRAALAQRVGLFSVPGLLGDKMEEFADANAEPVGPEFFKIRKLLTRRSYAEIFAALEGVDGNFVTEGRKKQLLERVDSLLWSAIAGFQGQLSAWQQAWMQGSSSPAMMMSLMAGVMTGGAGGALPPGLMQPPDTGTLRDQADAVSDALNKVFAGTGVQIAAALAYDAARVKEILINPQLPAMVGAANRDQMLRQLGVAVPPTYPRLETNLTRFVLGILHAKDQPAGNEEVRYYGTLYMLGAQIPWEELSGNGTVKRPTGIGSDGPRRDGARSTRP